MGTANIHDSQMLPMLLDPETANDYFLQIQSMLASALKTYTKKSAATIRLAKQPKIVTEKISNQSLSGTFFCLRNHVHGW